MTDAVADVVGSVVNTVAGFGPSLDRGMYGLVRPILFRRGGGDPERAHEWTLRQLARLDSSRALRATVRRTNRPVRDPVTVFGVDFPNRVGLAAGMVKNGEALRAWAPLGFGFAELGTVTARAQPGNPQPRLYRLRKSEALINRMGFNNDGAAALASRLRQYGANAAELQRALGTPVGISLGKSKVTPLADAVADYVESLRQVAGYAAYVAVNVSSPNTPGLRELQDRGLLDELVAALRAEAPDLPLLVKIAPDLSHEAIDDVLAVCRDRQVAGIIATNTTTARKGIEPAEKQMATETGGLSGRPLTEAALEVVKYVRSQVGAELPIIGVGGISSADDAQRMVEAGAALVQIYSGLIFTGPKLIRTVARRLARTPAR